MAENPKLTKKQQDEKDYKEIWEYQPKTNKILFYVWLFSGLIILGIGIFLLVNDGIATGVTSAGKRGGAGGKPTFITGGGATIIAALILLPVLFRKRGNKL